MASRFWASSISLAGVRFKGSSSRSDAVIMDDCSVLGSNSAALAAAESYISVYSVEGVEYWDDGWSFSHCSAFSSSARRSSSISSCSASVGFLRPSDAITAGVFVVDLVVAVMSSSSVVMR